MLCGGGGGLGTVAVIAVVGGGLVIDVEVPDRVGLVGGGGDRCQAMGSPVRSLSFG